MSTTCRNLTVLLGAGCLLVATACGGKTKQEPSVTGESNTLAANTGQEPKAVDGAATWKTAVKPKDMSAQVDKGLAWLVAHQTQTGGWGQGDESAQMGRSAAMEGHIAKANVADTSMALMALMRSGSTASAGKYKAEITRGINYIIGEVAESDDDSLYVTSVRGTRVQGKIGTYVDTFTALNVLTEAKGTMADADANKRLDKALAKILAKMEKNQQTDGTWNNQGWAPVLSQSIAAKGLNRAAQSGQKVNVAVLRKVEDQAREQFDSQSKGFSAGGSAGVDLYSGAANSSSLRDSTNTRMTKNKELKRRMKTAPTKDERESAAAELRDNDEAAIATATVEAALIEKLENPQFVSGFGNNGGEEFLSYMLVSEALVVKGGAEWSRWDATITKLVNKVQNADGSWTGHHCITGRTFCTAAALLVLLADRTPVPVAAQIAK